ncbi:MAG: heat-inducible transcriptional repressor HrcA [Actinomycetes bacterium]
MSAKRTKDSALSGSAGEQATELNDRRSSILEAVVSEYIQSAQPVGSSHVVTATGLSVSPATIRSEMALLEQEGYLTQPHTSAGRVPTDKGYRFFVDHLTTPQGNAAPQVKKVRNFFDHIHGEMEHVLEESSNLLANLTSYASVVVAPGHTTTEIASVQLVALSATSVLVLIVLSDGTVEKSTVDLGSAVDAGIVTEASNLLNATYKGAQLQSLSAAPTSPNAEVQKVLAAVTGPLSLLSKDAGESQVFVGGPSKLADAFDAVETVRSVLSILEQQLVVVSLLRDVLSSGLSVAIGHEHGYEPLASCAVIVAPLEIDGKAAGAVGLLGPTRMHYPAAMAAANAVGQELSERLSTLGHEVDH